jgi:hypothetical protein
MGLSKVKLLKENAAVSGQIRTGWIDSHPVDQKDRCFPTRQAMGKI